MPTGTVLFNPFTGKPRYPADIASDPHGHLLWDGEEPLRAATAPSPIDMLLFCPNCGRQHIDAPHPQAAMLDSMCDAPPNVPDVAPWNNPPHRSHLCHHCAHIWRPADVPTNGVQAIKTRGKSDSVAVLPVRTGMLFGPREAEDRLALAARVVELERALANCTTDEGPEQSELNAARALIGL